MLRPQTHDIKSSFSHRKSRFCQSSHHRGRTLTSTLKRTTRSFKKSTKSARPNFREDRRLLFRRQITVLYLVGLPIHDGLRNGLRSLGFSRDTVDWG
jgi:hypothetical protein